MTKSKKTIVLIVSGTIASPKSLVLATLLARRYHVITIGSQNNVHFLTAKQMQQFDYTSMWPQSHYKKGSYIWHVEIAKKADLMVVYSASATFIAKASHGLLDNPCNLAFGAFFKPKIILPAMNNHMWTSHAVQRNVALLTKDPLVTVIPPQTGPLACAPNSNLVGRAHEPDSVYTMINEMLG